MVRQRESCCRGEVREGLLAIGSGMALGREGPTVQIGAGLGQLIGKAFQRNDNERRVLLAAGAGAGLATAFNAPIAGAIFVLEELVGGFDVPVTIATLARSRLSRPLPHPIGCDEHTACAAGGLVVAERWLLSTSRLASMTFGSRR